MPEFGKLWAGFQLIGPLSKGDAKILMGLGLRLSTIGEVVCGTRIAQAIRDEAETPKVTERLRKAILPLSVGSHF